MAPENGALGAALSLVPAPGGGAQAVQLRFSSLSPAESLLTEGDLDGLLLLANEVQTHFSKLYAQNRNTLALDLEFKILPPDRTVLIKQVRPYVEATNPRYSLGGDHFTDSLDFDYNGLHYVYYHASFNEYCRACQPMHCMRVYDGSAERYDTSSLIEYGCTTDRSLPVVCVAVASDGGVPPLEDHFAPCPADPDWPS